MALVASRTLAVFTIGIPLVETMQTEERAEHTVLKPADNKFLKIGRVGISSMESADVSSQKSQTMAFDT